MKLYIYLNYGGNCGQAFRFYEQHLGGRITETTTHGEQPDQAAVPAGWKDAILHARLLDALAQAPGEIAPARS